MIKTYLTSLILIISLFQINAQNQNFQPVDFTNNQSKSITYKDEKDVQVALKADLGMSFITIDRFFEDWISKDNKFNYRLSVETEFIVKHNEFNKFSLLFNPTFNTYKSSTEFNDNTISIDYKSIEIPIGFRYYKVNKNSSLFINGYIVRDFPIESNIIFENRTDAEISSNFRFNVGIGTNFKKRLSLGLNYLVPSNITSKDNYVKASYSGIFLNLGYYINK